MTAYLLEDLSRALKEGPAAVLIRHAARAEDREATQLTEINQDGRIAAASLGASLCKLLRPSDAVVLGHSPVLRCEQTALAIAASLAPHIARCHNVGSRLLLARWYMPNPVETLRAAQQAGPRFVRQWFEGAYPPEWIKPLADTARRQVEGVVGELLHYSRPRLAVLISHDWNVLTVREHFFGIRYEDAGWIEFLDGITMVNNDGVKLRYRGAVIPYPYG